MLLAWDAAGSAAVGAKAVTVVVRRGAGNVVLVWIAAGGAAVGALAETVAIRGAGGRLERHRNSWRGGQRAP